MEVQTEDLVPQPSAEPDKGNLDSIISDAIKDVEAKNAPQADKSSEAPETNNDGRTRDERGRFVAKDSAPAKPSDKEPAKPDAKTAEPAKAEPVQAEQPLEAPARWSEADKAAFSGWPRDVQQAVLQRYKDMEADYTRKTQEIAETRKAYEPVHQELGKWSQYLQRLGLRPEQAINQMLTVEYNLRNGTPEQKQQALAYLAELYQASLPAQNSADPNAPQPAVDPRIPQLSRQVAELTQRLSEIQTKATQDERARAEAEFNALAQIKDQNGQPKYPHFEKVRQSMIQLVATGQAPDWDAAYSKAIRLDDELYKQTVEAERQRVLEEQEKARAEAIEKAKKAAPVKTSSAMPKGSAAATDLDSIIAGAMSKAGF
jgi:hypothetical protein